MPRLTLSKSSLSRERRQLKTYERFLPSLDLKRKQLMAERVKAQQAMAETRRHIDELGARVAKELPMMGTERVKLKGLARVAGYELGRENVVGTELPVLKGVQVEVSDYPLLGKPHWVDKVAELLRLSLELEIRIQVDRRRVELLEEAVRTVTQRVNLFDKVLIPRTRQNIKKIGIFLSDTERAAVVRAKIAKRKRAEAAAS